MVPTTPNKKIKGGSSNISKTLFGGGVKLPVLLVEIKYAANIYVSIAVKNHNQL